MKPRDLIKPYFITHWRTIALGLASLIAVDFMQLMVPRVIKWTVDDLTLLRADTERLLRYAAAIAALALMIGVFRYIWRRCLLGTARHLEAALRDRLLAHLQTLSASFFDRTKTGDLMAHATNDIQQVRMASGMGLVALNDAIVLGAAAIGFMLYIHVELTLYVLIPMPLVVLSARLLGRRLHRRYQGVQAAFSDLTEAIRERCAGVRMIKAHNAEAAALQVVEGVSRAYVSQNMRLVGVTGVFFPLMVLLTNLSLAIVLYLGGRKSILNEITPGDFVAFISYLGLLSWPMMALGWVTNLIQRGGASLQRLNTIFEQQPAISSAPDALPMATAEGRLCFEQVTFAYGDDLRQAALSDIRVDIPAGSVLGIVGPPGSGKSTLLSLVPRLYDATRGQITLDGRDLRSIELADLRRLVAYVPQEPFLFAGTVGENLLFGCGRQCESRFEQAVADAGLTETLAALPAGLETRVGEKGVLISGGQKQRIALARAMLVDTPLLLLDDPISQVDTRTAATIVAAIRRMAGQKTILIASHRLSAVHFADQIITLDQGRVVESGTHEELSAGNGYYAKVHALQEFEHAR